MMIMMIIILPSENKLRLAVLICDAKSPPSQYSIHMHRLSPNNNNNNNDDDDDDETYYFLRETNQYIEQYSDDEVF